MFRIPLPPLSEQTRIVTKLETMLTEIDGIEQSQNEINGLKTAIWRRCLSEAISGRLTTQQPSDGSADDLLEQIKAAHREAFATTQKKYKPLTFSPIPDSEIPFEIPENWRWVRLGEICLDLLDGDWIESKDQSDDGIRLIQTGNIGLGNFKDKQGKYHFISESTFNRLGCTEIFAGDILVSRLPEPVGRSCMIPETGFRMITAVDCTIVRVNENYIMPNYFIYYTQSNCYLSLVEHLCAGSTRKRISKKNLTQILIPLPPLSEQSRIVSKLEKLRSALDKRG